MIESIADTNNRLAELRGINQWVNWRLEERDNKPTKIPYIPKAYYPSGSRIKAKSNDASTGRAFQDAWDDYKANKDMSGVGIILTKDMGYVGIDLDACLDDNGQPIDQETIDIVKRFNSYTEVSPSGKGLRILVKGKFPDENKQGYGSKEHGIEIYCGKRYLTITGKEIKISDDVKINQDAIDWMIGEKFKKAAKLEDITTKKVKVTVNQHFVPLAISNLSKEHQDILAKARAAKNGQAFSDLYDNVGSANDDRSHRCFCLAVRLAWWMGPDPIGIEMLMSASCWKTYDKYMNRPEWREHVIEEAIMRNNDFYSGIQSGGITESFDDDFDFDNPEVAIKNHMHAAADFLYHHPDQLRYCPGLGWGIWNGKKYSFIDDAGAKAALSQHCQQQSKNSFLKANREYYGTKGGNHHEITAVLSQLASVKAVRGFSWDFDEDPELINLQNVILDLRSLKGYEHDPEYKMSKIAAIESHKSELCPRWNSFISWLTDNDPNLASYLQVCAGYTLLGSNPDQVLFVFRGPTRAGKSVFVETLKYILGEYACYSQPDAFLKGKTEDKYSLAQLSSVRMVILGEPSHGAKFNTSVIKSFTGDSKMLVRQIFGKPFEFKPVAKLWIPTNHDIGAGEGSDSIYRRIRLIVATKSVSEAERDPNLINKFKEEAAGILNWCLVGLQKYFKDGKIIEPQSILSIKKDVQEGDDVVGEFLEEKTETHPQGKIQASKLYSAYVQYCKDSGIYTLGRPRFKEALRDRGIEQKKQADAAYYIHLKFKSLIDDMIKEDMESFGDYNNK